MRLEKFTSTRFNGAGVGLPEPAVASSSTGPEMVVPRAEAAVMNGTVVSGLMVTFTDTVLVNPPAFNGLITCRK